MRNFSSISHLEHFRHSERGQVLVLVALAMVTLLLMAGLGVDVGYLRYQKQQMQKAADAGAIAGTDALEYNGDWLDAARNEAAANGFKNGVNGITVTVNNPPQSGAFTGDTNMVQVIVSQARPTFFMLVGGFTSVNVSARATGAVIQPASGCIYVLDPSANNAMVVSGGSTVNAQCGILDDSNSSNAAFVVSGGQSSVTASYIGVVGGDSDGGTVSPAPTTGIATFSDPLAHLAEPASTPINCSQVSPPPAPAGCTYSSNNGLTCSQSPSSPIQAGTYCGGITISGNGTTAHFGADSHGNTMFILAGGGLSVQGGANAITDTGVTFFNTYNNGNNPGYKPVVISGGSTTSMSAPTSGTYQGVLFFQDRNIPSNYKGSSGQQNTVSGQSGASFQGVLYFPNTPLVFSGGSTPSSTEIVADTLSITGSSSFNAPLDSGGLSGIKTATLVE